MSIWVEGDVTTKNTKAIAYLLALSVIWGHAYLLTDIVIVEVPPVLFVVGRHLVGALILLPVLFRADPHVLRSLRAWLRFGVMGVIGSFLPFLALAWGQQSAPSGLAALLSALVPPITLILAATLRLERVTPILIAGVCVAFVGVGLISLRQMAAGIDALPIAALGAASLCFAAGNVYSRKYLSSYDPGVVASGQMLVIAVLGTPVALVLVMRDSAAVEYSVSVVSAWVAVGVFATGFAYILFHWLAREVGPTRLSLVSYLVPVIGVASGVLFLGEEFYPEQVGGGALILTGVALSTWAARRNSARGLIRGIVPGDDSTGDKHGSNGSRHPSASDSV